MSWNAEQQRLLSALGYTLYRQAGTAPAPAAAPTMIVQDAVGEASVADAPAANSRLSQALQRAAAGRDVSGLVGDMDALRRDPLKKRALWPRLRALRRAH